MVRGLSSAEAAARLVEHGPNEISREHGPSPLAVLASQFASPMVWLLFAACAVAMLLGQWVDASAIGAILLLNALVGFAQEYRAERSLLALRSITAPRARVLRDGRAVLLPAREVVPGDLLLLEAGDLVAADASLVEAQQLSTLEAALTGESAPVPKLTAPVPEGTPLPERSDTVFLGTSVVTGSGAALTLATGMGTELGRIARLLATAREEPTPLQRRLEALGKTLLVVSLLVVSGVALLGAARGLSAAELLLSSISLAVAVIPEGMPAIVTISLAIGVQRMAARNVLVRKLAAVETLGSTTVICTDKTGTLTTGSMEVRELWGDHPRDLFFAAAACSDAQLDESGLGGTGDPTELAILKAALPLGIRREELERERPRREVHPFDPALRRMSILRADGVLYLKGAVDTVLGLCRSGTAGALEANLAMAERGLRVLAVASGSREGELKLWGLLGIADPPRSEVIEAVETARRAGIRTVMITGDHPATARAIARELGILRPGEDPSELVHARAAPELKLEIVRRWKSRNQVVAMTGDGVNDAPALREAHVGIAMGKTGTEVAREAADMVLTDDNYASIVAAVQEGRGVFANIRKALVYLLSGNASELLVMLGAALAALPLPFHPAQLLWINLVSDGLPALALVMDPASKRLLRQPPQRPGEPLLGRAQWLRILLTGMLEGAVALGAFAWALSERGPGPARDLAFATLVFCELFRAFAARSETELFLEVGAFNNLKLLGVVALTAALQVSLYYLPLTRAAFRLSEPRWTDFALALFLGLIPVTALELAKLARRARLHPAARAGA